jgi:hypothetical protein
MNQIEVTQTRLKELLSYDPETGVFTRLSASRGTARKGSAAGSVNGHGYAQIMLDGRRYKAHRLVWLWVHGCFPVHDIDHVNGDRADNRIANLRPATNSQNGANTGAYKNNTSGVKGVCLHKGSGKWMAQTKHQCKKKYIGLFATRADAKAAYDKAASALFGEYARVS